jgi:hypothetical protein
MEYRYLIICDNFPPALTHWYDYENNYNHESNMMVFDFRTNLYTKDGINWEKIEQDHL